MAVHRSAGAGASFSARVEVTDGATVGDLATVIRGMDRAAATAIRRRIREGIATAGAGMVAAVRAEASWSTRIPGTVRAVTSFSKRGAGVTITAGGAKAPEARPLEFGNRSGGAILRHPVFARSSEPRDSWTWVDQPTRPFFFRGVQAADPKTEAAMQKVLDDVAHDLGFK